MAYQDDETSVQNGAPVEIYTLEGNGTVYRYTSFQKDVVVGGETYKAVPISRTAVENSSQDQDDISIEITLPYDAQVVLDFMFSSTPPSLFAKIQRAHRGDTAAGQTMWQGKVISFNVEGREARLSVPALLSYAFERPVPSKRYQGPCNHVLYDSWCKVSRAANSQVAQVSQVMRNEITVLTHGFDDDACASGEMIFGDQRRMIMSNSGNTFVLSSGFRDINVTDQVTISKGCDHSFATCRAKFSNGQNFGGFPLVPEYNPFRIRL